MNLRARLLLALLATSAVTLAVAALALLQPLQHRLDRQSREAVSGAALATRQQLETTLAHTRGEPTARVDDILDTLAQRTSGRVGLYTADHRNVYAFSGITDPNHDDIRKVVASGKTRPTESKDGSGVAVAITPQAKGVDVNREIPVGQQFFVLLVQKSDPGGSAVDVVRSAFLTAAAFGLLVALLLGIALSTGLSRRLGRLRRSALALARDGVNAPPPPLDAGRDEVGDLARALASMQQALRRQEEARRAFVATASHELRTPLTSLQGNLELLLEDLDAGHLDVEDAADVLRGGQQQLRRMSNLASELLDLSRLDAGVQLRSEPVEIGELVRAVAAEFALRAADRDVELDVVPPTGPVWASGDPGAVARAARILIDNALRFSPTGEAIRITTAYHGSTTTLEVADHGPGVPVAERDLIFERFQRGSRTGGEGGFGLGLAIGRELARRLGGELELATQSEAGGARFVLTLPIEMPRGTGASEDAAGEAGEATGEEQTPPPAVPTPDA
ncbi:sensor histidine kinase [Conexibacter woesei]|uniref:sensor histidine kinase n=1 Tax=Conexibacter woesei TaxID=191495 RepID=UPI000406529B|nr:HAMP domain-containing sensor histidine kinase [Conexibacter woesei]